MTEPKPFASLSPGLLARKGAARPAMRPQLQPMHQFHEATARQLEEDLGWNDMGHDVVPVPEAVEPPPPAEVVPIAPAAAVPQAHVPEIVRQQAEVAERVVSRVEPAPVAARPAPSGARARRSALGDGRRAAFTLRLDAERHLKLRLACTVAGRSAQQLVTEALDRLISGLPDIESLAAQVRKRK